MFCTANSESVYYPADSKLLILHMGGYSVWVWVTVYFPAVLVYPKGLMLGWLTWAS